VLGEHDRRDVGVGRRRLRDQGGVDHRQADDAEHPTVRVHDRAVLRLQAHRAGPDRVVIGHRGGPDPRRRGRVVGDDLARRPVPPTLGHLGQRPTARRLVDDPQALGEPLQVGAVPEIAEVDLRRRSGVRTAQAEAPP
jgi:hypothetical protein